MATGSTGVSITIPSGQIEVGFPSPVAPFWVVGTSTTVLFTSDKPGGWNVDGPPIAGPHPAGATSIMHVTVPCDADPGNYLVNFYAPQTGGLAPDPGNVPMGSAITVVPNPDPDSTTLDPYPACPK